MSHEPADYYDLLRRARVHRPDGAELPRVALAGDECSADAPVPDSFGAASALEPALSLLRHRAGAPAVHHLLTQTSLFWPLPNDNLLQISGPAPIRYSNSASRAARKHTSAVVGLNFKVVEKRTSESLMGHGSRSEARGAEMGEAGDDAQPRRKRPRLSNWRRRKQKAEQRTVPEQAAATVDDEAGDQSTVSYHAGAGDENCGGLAPNDSAADAPVNAPNSRVSLTLRAGEGILPSRRSLRKLLRRLLARHHRCSYHMLLRRHLAERPSSTRGGGAEWSEVNATARRRDAKTALARREACWSSTEPLRQARAPGDCTCRGAFARSRRAALRFSRRGPRRPRHPLLAERARGQHLRCKWWV